MSAGVALRRGRRRSRSLMAVPLLSALVLIVGWSLLWVVARQQVSAGLDGFIAAEAAHGRRWTCPDRTVDGFPFRIAVSCRDVGFAGLVDGSPGQGRLAGLAARTWVHEPNAVYLVLDGPLSLTTADGRADFTLTWARLGAKLRGVFGDRRRAEVVGEELSLSRPRGGGGAARRLEVHAGPALDAAAAPDAAAAEVALSGLAAPGIDAVTGEAAPLDGLFTGSVTYALGDLPDLGPATVDRWRAAGGRLDVSNVTLTKGPLSVGAAGALGLDSLHRVQGRLDARFGGFEPLAKRFGVSLGAVQVGGLLANLLGTRPAPVAAPGTVSLPVLFADGTVSVGPFKTGLRLPPLY